MTTTPDFRALCAELVCSVELLLDMRNSVRPMKITEDRLIRARAVLATPPPKPPTDDEILKLTENISPVHLCKHKSLPSDWDFGDYACSPRGLIDIARAVLERWGK